MWKRNGLEYNFDDTNWTAIVNLMDDDLREEVHAEVAPCSNRCFFEIYLKKDPEFEQVVAENFGIEWFYKKGDLEIGATYEDPEGVWEVTGYDGKYVDIKCIQEGNLNEGDIFVVSKEEAEYYLKGGE